MSVGGNVDHLIHANISCILRWNSIGLTAEHIGESFQLQYLRNLVVKASSCSILGIWRLIDAQHAVFGLSGRGGNLFVIEARNMLKVMQNLPAVFNLLDAKCTDAWDPKCDVLFFFFC